MKYKNIYNKILKNRLLVVIGCTEITGDAKEIESRGLVKIVQLLKPLTLPDILVDKMNFDKQGLSEV
jgi:hypothetical protein